MGDLELEDITGPTLVAKSEIDKKAEELKNKIKLPKRPGENVQFRDYQEWLKIVPDSALEQIMLYMYRLEPPINRQFVNPDSDNNIDVVSGDNLRLFTEEHIKNTHGGGKYWFRVKDCGATAKATGEGFKVRLSIPTIDCPPNLDLMEVDWTHRDCKGFRAWALAKGLIDKNNMPVEVEKKDIKTDSLNGDAMVSMMKVMTDFVGKMNQKDQDELKRKLAGEDATSKGVMEILIEKMKQEDPNKQLTAMATLMTAVKGMQPEAKSNDAAIFTSLITMVTGIMTMMNESNKSHSDMMMVMMKNMMEGNKNDEPRLSDEERLLKLVEISKAIKGGGTPESKHWSESIIEGVTNLAGPALQLVNNIMVTKSMSGNPPGGIPTGGMNAPTQTPIAQASVKPLNDQTVTPSPVPAINQSEIQGVIQQFGPTMMQHLQNGTKGWEFADMVANMWGVGIIARVKQYDLDTIMNAAKSVPQFWQPIEQTFGEAHMRKWFEEFINYEEIIAKMEQEEIIEENKQDAV